MRNIDNYISEKLVIDKDVQISKNEHFNYVKLDRLIENYFNTRSDYDITHKLYKGKELIGTTIRIDFTKKYSNKQLQEWAKDICEKINTDTDYEWYNQHLSDPRSDKCFIKILIAKK